MTDILTDEDRNFVIVNGDLVITRTEAEGIAQNIKQRLRTLKGEWFLDRTIGLPYFEIILEKNPNSNIVATLFKKTILETQGVARLNKFSLSFDSKNRTSDITFEVTTVSGETILETEVA